VNATPHPSLLLVRDELVGFARSRVMLAMWVVLPLCALLGYLALPDDALLDSGFGAELSATAFMALLLSSLAGTVAAVMVAADIVGERNRNVYELFLIRPIRPEAIIWAKFVAVFGCVAIACTISLGLGLGLDRVQGATLGSAELGDAGRALVSLLGVVGLSAAVGVFFGVVSRSIVIAVVLVLYIGQNLAIIPMLPIYLGVLPEHFWIVMAVTSVLVVVVLWAAAVLFRRAEY
jgi:ABC-2 type transport system permease protein